jgi:uncharacterized delta-60 repeat protein
VDQAFGKYGRRVIDSGAYWEYVDSLGLQSDGTIVAGVHASNPVSPSAPNHIIGLTPSGAEDPNFGNAGDVAFDERIHALAVAPDDSIAFAGSARLDSHDVFAVGRLNPDGSRDSSFAGGGSVLTRFNPGDSGYALHVAVAPDGKIVAGGRTKNPQSSDWEFALARYLVNPDPPADGGSPAAGSGPASGTPLVLSGLKLTNRTFAVARRSTAAVGHAQAVGSRKHGTAFVYTLNRAATVTIRVKRLRGRAKPITLKRSSAAGRNRVRFTGRVRHRALHPGLYRATLTATDASGARSALRTARFRIVR